MENAAEQQLQYVHTSVEEMVSIVLCTIRDLSDWRICPESNYGNVPPLLRVHQPEKRIARNFLTTTARWKDTADSM